jgi:hypothetical protein
VIALLVVQNAATEILYDQIPDHLSRELFSL